MMLATRVRRQLYNDAVSYSLINHQRTETLEQTAKQLDLPLAAIARTVFIRTPETTFMLILSVERRLNLQKLDKIFNRKYTILRHDDVDSYFADCEPGCHPPLPRAYNFTALIDRDFGRKQPQVYFEAGCHTSLIKLAASEFRYLLRNTQTATLSTSADVARRDSTNPTTAPWSQNLLNKLEQQYIMPKLPAVAHRLLALAKQSELDPEAVLEIIAEDQQISKSIINISQLNELTPGTEVSSVDDVAHKVFDFDTISHVAISIAAGSQLKLPKSGPIGLDNFWQHALECARLAKVAATHISSESLLPNLAFLAGLVHNFGLLVLGHLCAPEFNMLNRLMLSSPRQSITTLERKIVGMGQAQQLVALGHAKLGALLMQSWQMPELIIVVAREHHNANYEGPYEKYVRLIQLVNLLLDQRGVGDRSHLNQEQLQAYFNLDTSTINELIKIVSSEDENFTAMMQQMAP